MAVKTALVSVFVLLISCGDSGGPFDPGQGNDARFFPLAVGNTWEYTRYGTYNIENKSYTVTGASVVSIIGIAAHSGGFDVFIEESAVNDTIMGLMIQSTVDTCYIRLASNGFHGYPSLASTDSSWVVPFPLIAGMVWPFSTNPPMTGELLSMDETVTVPAGTFQNCFEMRTLWIEGGNLTSNSSFAPNVGLVKNVYSQGVEQISVNITSRLSDYQLSR